MGDNHGGEWGEAWGCRKGRLMRDRVRGAGHVKSQADREEAWTSVVLMGRGCQMGGGTEPGVGEIGGLLDQQGFDF